MKKWKQWTAKLTAAVIAVTMLFPAGALSGMQIPVYAAEALQTVTLTEDFSYEYDAESAPGVGEENKVTANSASHELIVSNGVFEWTTSQKFWQTGNEGNTWWVDPGIGQLMADNKEKHKVAANLTITPPTADAVLTEIRVSTPITEQASGVTQNGILFAVSEDENTFLELIAGVAQKPRALYQEGSDSNRGVMYTYEGSWPAVVGDVVNWTITIDTEHNFIWTAELCGSDGTPKDKASAEYTVGETFTASNNGTQYTPIDLIAGAAYPVTSYGVVESGAKAMVSALEADYAVPSTETVLVEDFTGYSGTAPVTGNANEAVVIGENDTFKWVTSKQIEKKNETNVKGASTYEIISGDAVTDDTGLYLNTAGKINGYAGALLEIKDGVVPDGQKLQKIEFSMSLIDMQSGALLAVSEDSEQYFELTAGPAATGGQYPRVVLNIGGRTVPSEDQSNWHPEAGDILTWTVILTETGFEWSVVADKSGSTGKGTYVSDGTASNPNLFETAYYPVGAMIQSGGNTDKAQMKNLTLIYGSAESEPTTPPEPTDEPEPTPTPKPEPFPPEHGTTGAYFSVYDDFESYTSANAAIGAANAVGQGEYVAVNEKQGFSWQVSTAESAGIGYVNSENGQIVARTDASGTNYGLIPMRLNDYQKMEMAEVSFETTRNPGTNAASRTGARVFPFNGDRGGLECVHMSVTNLPRLIMRNENSSQVLADGPAYSGDVLRWTLRVTGNTLEWKVTSPEDPNYLWEDSRTMSQTVSGFGSTFPPFSEWFRGSSSPIEIVTQSGTAAVDKVQYITGDPYTVMGEPGEVVYADIAAGRELQKDGTLAFAGTNPVRHIIAPQMAGKTIQASAIDADGKSQSLDITFDENGDWMNAQTSAAFKKIVLPMNGNDYSGLQILSDISETNVISMVRRGTLKLDPRIGDCTVSSVEYSSSAPEIASVDAEGNITANQEGSAVITIRINYNIPLPGRATDQSSTFTVRTRVIGRLTDAVESGTVDEYLQSKAGVDTAYNNALRAEDITMLDDFLTGDAPMSVAAIEDIDQDRIKVLKQENPTAYQEYLVRLKTYEPDFSFSSAEALRGFIDMINMEYEIYQLNHVSDVQAMGSVLEKTLSGTPADEEPSLENNLYGLEVDNTFYLEERENVLQALCNQTFQNYADLQSQFIENYVILNYQNTLSTSYIGKIVIECAEEIGYNQTRFNQLTNKTALYRALMAEKARIGSLEEMKDFIDTYTPSDEDNNSSSGGSNGGGGGGGKGSGSGVSIGNTSPVEMPDFDSDGILVERQQIYSDVPINHWAFEPIRFLTAKDAISGNGDGTFSPENPVTRAEFLKMMLLGCGIAVQPEGTPADTDPAAETVSDEQVSNETAGGETTAPLFNDVAETDWYYPYIKTAKEQGIIRGDEANNCNPDTPISREEMAAMIYRTVEAQNHTLPKNTDLINFSDADTISDWAFAYVTKLQLAGVLQGSDGMFHPLDNATRAEAAKTIYTAVRSMQPIVTEEEGTENEAESDAQA